MKRLLALLLLVSSPAAAQITVNGQTSINALGGMLKNASNATLPAARTNLGVYLIDPVSDYGAPTNGTSDASAAMTTALAGCSAASGGIVEVGPYRFLLNSADFVIPAACKVVGLPTAQAIYSAGGNFATSKYTFILNPSFKLVSGGLNAGIQGVSIINKNLDAPTSYQQANTEIVAFSGTAIQIDHSDFTLDAFVIGFSKCVVSNSERPIIQHLFGDCTNGLEINNATDVASAEQLHFWPFYTANTAYSLLDLTVSGAVDNGSGAVRLTVNATANLATGNVVQVASVGGATGANGRRTITVIDGTHVDLQGTTFGGVYTSGGHLYLNNTLRIGTALKITDSQYPVIQTFFEYGHDIGAELAGTTTAFVSILSFGSDGYLAATQNGDTTPVGLKITNSDRSNFGNGYISSKGTSIYHSATSTNGPDMISGMAIGATGQYGIDLEGGSLSFVNSTLTGGKPLRVADAATQLWLRTFGMGTSAFEYQTASNWTKVLGNYDQMLIAGSNEGSAGFPPNTIAFLGLASSNGTEAQVQIPIPKPGILRELAVFQSVASGTVGGTQSITYTSRINGVDGTNTCTISGATDLSCHDDKTHTDAVTTDDKFDLKVSSSVTAGTPKIHYSIVYSVPTP